MYLEPFEIDIALDALRYRESWCTFQGHFGLAQSDRDLISYLQKDASLFPDLTGKQTLHIQSALMRKGTPEAIALVKTLANRASK